MKRKLAQPWSHLPTEQRAKRESTITKFRGLPNILVDAPPSEFWK
jgi:hypothetical protein